MTATQLFAKARGIKLRHGSQRCFYCGGSCDESNLSAEVVKDSFTSRDTVFGGDYVCAGCIAAMEEKGSLTLACGEHREGQKLRGYSWVIGRKAIAATKSHREWLLGQCLTPPKPPFVISISDSGQKHLLYRAVVCHSQDVVTATLEAERVTYRPAELIDRVTLCKLLIAASGKPALDEPLSHRTAMNIVDHHGDVTPVETWQRVCDEPLSRLAVWLSPPKEVCLNEFPSRVTAPAPRAKHRAVPAEVGWIDRSPQRTLAYGD